MIGHALEEIIPDATFIDSKSYDLRNQLDANYLFMSESPDQVIHLAAKVGGVKANSQNLGSFYYDNIMINTNVLEAARKYKAKKVLSFLSTCVYPDEVAYPLTEEQIHNGSPHLSNYAYAHAKRMLDIQSQAYRDQYGCNFVTVIPNNLFGEYDNFDLENSHLVPAIIRKVYDAKEGNKDVVLWGDGKALREFTYSKDLAKIVLLLLDKHESREPINVGNTEEYSVKEVAEIIANIMEFDGNIIWDTTQPVGQHRKPSDNSNLIKLGWKAADFTPFVEALGNTCKWFVKNYPNVRGVK
jgi:GDP-L-fucose synthase